MEKTKDSRWIRGEPIGKGSFGTVSVGFDRQNGRVFAVKSVAVNSGTVAQVEAIENEISVLRSLSSPFVVQYYADDVTAEPTAVYRNLHMEYLPGGTAAELSKKSGAEAEELVRRCTRCLVSALQYVHSRGVIHCDVKGKNVLLGTTPGIAKLADFGSAKLADGRRDKIVPRGSPLWMAPEVVRGESQGPASDVWALGCTVIEMITGAPAWLDDGADTLCRIGYSDELPCFPTRLSGDGKDFLEKCLNRDPARRWSCDQLLQHPFLCHESTVAIQDSLSPCSVIGWPRFELTDDDEEGDESAWGSHAGSHVQLGSSSALGRIGKLAGPEGANWESNGWVGVRGALEEVVVDSLVGFSANEEVGASSEFSESWGANQEFESSTQAASSECCSSDGWSGGGDGWAGAEGNVGFSFTAAETPHISVGGELSVLYDSNHQFYYYYLANKNAAYIPFFVVILISHLKWLFFLAIYGQSQTTLKCLKLNHLPNILHENSKFNGIVQGGNQQ